VTVGVTMGSGLGCAPLSDGLGMSGPGVNFMLKMSIGGGGGGGDARGFIPLRFGVPTFFSNFE
jgi:hypothetical protein